MIVLQILKYSQIKNIPKHTYKAAIYLQLKKNNVQGVSKKLHQIERF